MKNNPISHIIRLRLEELGLAQIPAAAIAYIEHQMERELRRIAAHKLTSRSVALSILKAVSVTKTSPSFTLTTENEPKPDRA